MTPSPFAPSAGRWSWALELGVTFIDTAETYEPFTNEELVAPSNPDWYYNLAAAGDGSVERGTETYKVTVRELTGAERDRIYAEQARRHTGFAGYARQTAGVRTIPVLELRRA